MIECFFCYSPSKDSYLFTECSHLVCSGCAAAKWDHRYTLKCCQQPTFLAEETSQALQLINQADHRLRAQDGSENN